MMTSHEFETQLDKSRRQLKAYYNSLIRDLKPAIFGEAIAYVKSQTSHLTRILSNEHHNIINQYFAYKLSIKSEI